MSLAARWVSVQAADRQSEHFQRRDRVGPVRMFGGVIERGELGRLAAFPGLYPDLAEWHDGAPEPALVAPLGCAGGQLRVSLVGRLDNRDELVAELETHGHRCVATSDADVVAHAYEEWGEACVHCFCGAFAISVWDPRSQTLWLARDRAGARAVYYSDVGRSFAFASDLATLRALVDVPRAIDPDAVDAYLTFGAIPAPLTIFRSVRKLPAAHTLRLSRGVLTVAPYWSLGFWDKAAGASDRLEERVGELLLRATSQMIGRHSCELMFSGGLDSSILLELLASAEPARPLRALTFVFPGKREDGDRSRAVAGHLHLPHEIVECQPCVADAVADIAGRYHQPYADGSALTLGCVMPALRGSRDVLLSGEGADEVFGGHTRHLAACVAARLAALPGGAFGARRVAALTKGRLRNFLESVPLSPVERYLRSVGTIQPSTKERLYTRDFAARIDRYWSSAVLGRAIPNDVSPLDQTLAGDIALWAAEILSPRLDPAQGAEGLEMRTPFLDHRILEFSTTLPDRLKVGRDLTTKVLLRRIAARRRIPVPTSRWRDTKSKLSIAESLRGELRPMVEDVLCTPTARQRGYFNPLVVRRLADAHAAGRADHARELWALLMLELWHRRSLDC